MKNNLLLSGGLILIVGLILGLFAGYRIGFAVRDYEAARETIARDAELRETNVELGELRLRLALVNADLAGMTREIEWRLGIGGGSRPSGED